MNHILDSNGTAIYDGERIKIVTDSGKEIIGNLEVNNIRHFFKPDGIVKKYNIRNFRKFYKLMEREVIYD